MVLTKKFRVDFLKKMTWKLNIYEKSFFETMQNTTRAWGSLGSFTATYGNSQPKDLW